MTGPAPDLSAPGTLLAGKYEVVKQLGRGSFGRVLLSRDTSLGRMAAVKILDPAVATPELAERFLREARVTSSLRHPHIVTVYELGWHAGSAFIAYEYIDGKDLEALLKKGETIPDERAVEWGRQVADALALAHKAGVIHRDIKPANVLLRGGTHPIVCDFGIAKLSTSSATVHTATGVILGTPGYLAPEVWMGGAPTPASDQYAWAASLYELLYHQMVHGKAGPSEILDRIRAGTRPAIPAGFRGRHPGLEAALVRALALDPEDRFPDMAAFAAALANPEVPPAEPAAGTRERIESAPDSMLTSQSALSRDELLALGRKARAAAAKTPDPGAGTETGPPAAPGRKPGPAGTGADPAGPPALGPDGTKPRPPAGAPGPLPWARIAGGCALVAVALGLGFGPTPGAGPAPAPTAAARARPYASRTVQDRRARLLQAVDALAAGHAIEDRMARVTFHTGEREYEPHHQAGFLRSAVDAPLVARWVTYLDALSPWVQALYDWEKTEGGGIPAFDDPAVLDDWDTAVMRVGLHVLEDFRLSEDESMLRIRELVGNFEVFDTPGAVNEQLEVFRKATETGLRLEYWPVSRTPAPVQALQALHLALINLNLADPVLLARVRDRLVDSTDPRVTYWLAKALGYSLVTTPSEKVLPWTLRNQILKTLWHRLQDEKAWPGPEQHALALCRLAWEEMRAGRVFTKEPKHGFADQERVVAVLDRLGPVAEKWPVLLLDGLKSIKTTIDRAGGPFYTPEEPPEPMKPWLQQVRMILDRTRRAADELDARKKARGG